MHVPELDAGCRARRRSSPRARRSPAASAKPDAAAGKAIYDRECASCHGRDREGRRRRRGLLHDQAHRSHRPGEALQALGRVPRARSSPAEVRRRGSRRTCPRRSSPAAELKSVVAYVRQLSGPAKGAQVTPSAQRKALGRGRDQLAHALGGHVLQQHRDAPALADDVARAVGLGRGRVGSATHRRAPGLRQPLRALGERRTPRPTRRRACPPVAPSPAGRRASRGRARRRRAAPRRGSGWPRRAWSRTRPCFRGASAGEVEPRLPRPLVGAVQRRVQHLGGGPREPAEERGGGRVVGGAHRRHQARARTA